MIKSNTNLSLIELLWLFIVIWSFYSVSYCLPLCMLASISSLITTMYPSKVTTINKEWFGSLLHPAYIISIFAKISNGTYGFSILSISYLKRWEDVDMDRLLREIHLKFYLLIFVCSLQWLCLLISLKELLMFQPVTRFKKNKSYLNRSQI